jgi:hypothetical protein
MTRPDIELSEQSAAFVAAHPDLAESLAGRASDRSDDTPEVSALRVKVRRRVREQRSAFDPEQARVDGQAFLAQHGLS